MARGVLPSEAQIELQMLDYLVRVRRLLAWKQPNGGFFDTKRKRFRKHANPYTRSGVPDIICVIGGRFVGFEVKSARGTQSDSQKLFESDLRRSGGHYYLVRTLTELEDALDDFESSVENALTLS